MVAEADGRLLGFVSLAERGYILVPKLHLGTHFSRKLSFHSPPFIHAQERQ